MQFQRLQYQAQHVQTGNPVYAHRESSYDYYYHIFCCISQPIKS